MNVGSLFSGIGGIEIGMESVGFNTIWYVEKEPYCQSVLRKHYPKAIIYGDITEIDFRTVPTVDILTGGFPCQDISNAGKRAGIEGSRSSLWKHYLRAISTIRPKFAIIENVEALRQRGLNVVLSDLAKIGYDAEWHCISASSIGASHQRERLFIITYPNGQRCNNSENMGERLDCMEIKERQTEKESQRERWRILRSIQNDKVPGQQIRESLGFEPLISGKSHGFSIEMDRIKCLGNSVVPQCAEVFAKAIKEHTVFR